MPRNGSALILALRAACELLDSLIRRHVENLHNHRRASYRFIATIFGEGGNARARSGSAGSQTNSEQPSRVGSPTRRIVPRNNSVAVALDPRRQRGGRDPRAEAARQREARGAAWQAEAQAAEDDRDLNNAIPVAASMDDGRPAAVAPPSVLNKKKTQ